MAIYHLSAKVVSRGKGQSAIAAAAYRSGDPLMDERTGELKSYEERSLRIIHKEILAPSHAPEWVRDRNALWNAAERAEKRKDAQLAREIEVSLPHELTEQQRLYLVKDFAREAFVRQGYAVDLAIHTPDRGGDMRNHHAHLMITMRVIGPDGFAPTKDRCLNSPQQLERWREQWANLANRHLARHGYDARVDHRSLEAQGLEREPTIHVGYAAREIAARGAHSDRMDALNGVLERNGIRAELRATDEELAQLRELVANENRKSRVPGSSREPRPMLEGPTDDELRKQPEREQAYINVLKSKHERAEALLTEQRNAQELDKRAKDFQAGKEQEAEEGRKKAAHDAADTNDPRNGDISSASARYSIALGQTYDIRDPYASLGKAAGAESAMFHKTQEELKAAASKETDPDKRQAIELRRKIEGCEYMAVTNERLAGISETVTGRPDNDYAVKDRQQAAHYRAMAAGLREERGTVLERVQAKGEQQAQQGRGGDAQSAAQGSKERTGSRAGHYRSEMPAKVPEIAQEAPQEDKAKGKGERAGEGGVMPAPKRGNLRELRSPTANDGRQAAESGRPAELRVIDRDGKDAGTLAEFMEREQPRTSARYQPPKMDVLLSNPEAKAEHHRRQGQVREEQKNADRALGHIGGDLAKGRIVQAEDMRSLTREQWDGVRVKGEAGLVQSVREAKDRGSQDLGRSMGGPRPRPWEP